MGKKKLIPLTEIQHHTHVGIICSSVKCDFVTKRNNTFFSYFRSLKILPTFTTLFKLWWLSDPCGPISQHITECVNKKKKHIYYMSNVFIVILSQSSLPDFGGDFRLPILPFFTLTRNSITEQSSLKHSGSRPVRQTDTEALRKLRQITILNKQSTTYKYDFRNHPDVSENTEHKLERMR